LLGHLTNLIGIIFLMPLFGKIIMVLVVLQQEELEEAA
jgi:uncharacterized membrane protein